MKTKFFFTSWENGTKKRGIDKMHSFLKRKNIKPFITEQGTYYLLYGYLAMLYYEEV